MITEVTETVQTAGCHSDSQAEQILVRKSGAEVPLLLSFRSHPRPFLQFNVPFMSAKPIHVRKAYSSSKTDGTKKAEGKGGMHEKSLRHF